MSYPNISAKERFFTTTINPDSFVQWWMALKNNSKTQPILISGQENRTTSNFFKEIASKLGFPSYFGGNWNAFWDSLNDFYWEKDTTFVIMFNQADNLLIDAEKKDLLTLIEILNTAFREDEAYSEDSEIGGRFKIIFQVIPVGSKIVEALEETSTNYLNV
ncbi:barstar family protein [Nostoc sp. FACHB-892]|uniref:barstar family protein n=1 Tax=Nostoc sp. FACHB-892 TaxID=2692843 RepID=UPI0016843579|nr:barstar family protein [Nostoc sp. FACHB-892]MBD2726899.1 barstar family protein [Nostoc sp. FACHB-892]